MSFERSNARSGLSYPLHQQVRHGTSWSDHELWQRAGEPAHVEASMTVACNVAGGEEAPAMAEVATPDIEADERAGPRLRRRRELGRSLFSTFDMARRRCRGGTTIRMSGF